MAENRETRIIPVELRQETGSDGSPRLVGQAIVYNRLSLDLGGFREAFMPGSLTRSLERQEVVALWQHNPALVLGRTGNGTLVVEDTAESLNFVLTPPETTWARDAMVSVERRDVHQMSFGWNPVANGEDWRMDGGELLRIVREADLAELSLVTFPAYPQTSVELIQRAAELRAQLSGIDNRAGANGEPERAFRAELENRRLMIDIQEVTT